MRYALDTRNDPPTRIKAEKNLEVAGIPKGTFICPNPHCGSEVYVKGNDLAPSRIADRKNRNKEEKPVHVMPHWAHYTAEKGDIKYRDDDCIPHDSGCSAIEKFLGIPETDVELWFKGNIPEETVAPDIVYRFENQRYGIEVQHGLLSVDEYERRQKAYAIHGLIPIWILHKIEKRDFTPSPKIEESVIGNYGNLSYITSQIKKGALDSKLERRLARRQYWVLYYEFVGEFNIDDPQVHITAIKYSKMDRKKQSYIVKEEYDIKTKDQFEYVISQVLRNQSKYNELRDSEEFNEDDHYAWNDETENWYVQSKMYRCSETKKEIFFPPDVQVPDDYVIESVKKEQWEEKKPTWKEKREYYDLDELRYND